MTHNYNYNGQVLQDKYVLSVLKHKKNGFFLEIGSNDPKNINNSYLLEKDFDWSGVMIEYDAKWLPKYKSERSKSLIVINDATKVRYYDLLKSINAPKNIDYLQIDLEVIEGTTLKTLEILDETVFNEYKFASVTFEHDIYRGNYFDTREKSRYIFMNKGYILVFPDVKNGVEYPFEDWYVHPDLVDMDFINKIKTDKSLDYKEIMNIIDLNL
jgi:hypothetical protein